MARVTKPASDAYLAELLVERAQPPTPPALQRAPAAVRKRVVRPPELLPSPKRVAVAKEAAFESKVELRMRELRWMEEKDAVAESARVEIEAQARVEAAAYAAEADGKGKALPPRARQDDPGESCMMWLRFLS